MKIVFIVDDDPSHARVCERILKRAGFGVITAADGSQALRVLGQTQVDLVLTDLVMPDTDGFELLMALRTKTSQAPVIVMSGSGGTALNGTLLEQSRLLGASEILAKPFSESELLAAVHRALNQHDHSEPGASLPQS